MNKSAVQKIIKLDGVTCTACEYKIEKALKKQNGVLDVKVSYASSTADISFNPEEIDLENIYKTIEKTGYTVLLSHESSLDEDSSNSTTVFIVLILVGLYIIINNTIGFNFFPQVTQSMGYGMLYIKYFYQFRLPPQEHFLSNP